MGGLFGAGKWDEHDVELRGGGRGICLVSAGLCVGVPAGMGIWMKFLPLSLVTLDFLGSRKAPVFRWISTR